MLGNPRGPLWPLMTPASYGGSSIDCTSPRFAGPCGWLALGSHRLSLQILRLQTAFSGAALEEIGAAVGLADGDLEEAITILMRSHPQPTRPQLQAPVGGHRATAVIPSAPTSKCG